MAVGANRHNPAYGRTQKHKHKNVPVTGKETAEDPERSRGHEEAQTRREKQRTPDRKKHQRSREPKKKKKRERKPEHLTQIDG